MTTDEIMLALASEGYLVSLTHFNQSYMKPTCWHLAIARDDNPSFRLNTEAASLEEAVQLGWKRWEAMRGGLVAAISIGTTPTLVLIPESTDDF